MATHQVIQSVINAATGIPPSSDGVMGLVIKGVSIPGQIAYDTPYLLTSMDDATALGITAAYDSANGTAVYQQVNEFYQQAGTGAYLWLQVCTISTAFASYVSTNAFQNFLAGSAVADPLKRINIVGLCYNVPTTTQSVTDFPADVSATITALQTTQENMFNAGTAMFSAIVDGANMSSAVTPSTIGSMATNSAYAVSLCITGSKGNGVSSVGAALGRFARISIGHGFGEVADGAIALSSAYLTNGIAIFPGTALTVGQSYIVASGSVTNNGITYSQGQSFTVVTGFTSFTGISGSYVTNSTPVIVPNHDLTVTQAVSGLKQADIVSLGSKQYMFLTWVQNNSGLFWNDGATCCSTALAFSSQEYNRVANHLSWAALGFFTSLRGSNLPVDTKTGSVLQSWLNSKQQEYKDTYINPISVAGGGTGDLSDGSMTITGPNFNATKQLNYTLKFVPTPILGNVIGTIQSVSTL